jgi:hypothetical protein
MYLTGRFGKFRRIEIVETGEVHRIIGAADLLDVTVTEGRDAARPAEPVMAAHGAELIVGQFVFAREQAKRLQLDDGAPIASLGTDRAVALARAGAQVEVGLVADFAAMAASLVGPGHRSIPFSGLPPQASAQGRSTPHQ